MARATFSLSEARRIALRAGGFGAARRQNGSALLLASIRRMGLLQIDSVNVLVRSQYLPLFSRLGAYDRAALDRLAFRSPRRLFEYWGHVASLLPLETYPLLRWRMRLPKSGEGKWGAPTSIAREQPALVARVRKRIEREGPLSASDFEDARGSGSWWGWSDVKRALEYLFLIGEVSTSTRRAGFERVYDLAARVIPRAYYDAPELDAVVAQRELVAIAARAHGIATEADLRDYFRLSQKATRAAIATLCERGDISRVSVHGWNEPAYLAGGARLPRSLGGAALLSMFDPIVWYRERAERLFDFHYRIEIYTPAHKRVHGYYVLPYLVGERLAGRVDLKADRAARVLRVLGIHFEPGADRDAADAALGPLLSEMGAWLGCDEVSR